MSKVREILDIWGLELTIDLQKSIDKAVTHGGGQTSKLSGSVTYKILKTPDGYSFRLTMNDYWKWVDKGRAPTKNKGTGAVRKAVGATWQNLKGISPAPIIYELQIAYRNKKGLKYKVKKLPFAKAAKSLAFLISRSIHKKGIKPKPFFDKIFNQRRLDELSEMFKLALKQDIVFDLKEVLFAA